MNELQPHGLISPSPWQALLLNPCSSRLEPAQPVRATGDTHFPVIACTYTIPGSKLEGGNAERKKLQETATLPTFVCRDLLGGGAEEWGALGTSAV